MKSIAVLGLGRVGRLCAELLHHASFEVKGFDQNPVDSALPFAVAVLDVTDSQALDHVLSSVDAVLSCLPFDHNRMVVETAHRLGIDYFDLTEDEATTAYCQMLAKTATSRFIPQCGLAPGLIAILGRQLMADFDSVASCQLAVGALPCHPKGSLGYAFNWSPEGVINEYCQPCTVLDEGQITTVEPLGDLEDCRIDGVELEAFTTSGGLGTLYQTMQGQVQSLRYKTLRYPGHAKLMRFLLIECGLKAHPQWCKDQLSQMYPPDPSDIVYIHATCCGHIAQRLQRRTVAVGLRSQVILGRSRTAISWTTACSAVAVIELVRSRNDPPGFIHQQQFDLAALCETESGKWFKPLLDDSHWNLS